MRKQKTSFMETKLIKKKEKRMKKSSKIKTRTNPCSNFAFLRYGSM